jgi:hypothetical protein
VTIVQNVEEKAIEDLFGFTQFKVLNIAMENIDIKLVSHMVYILVYVKISTCYLLIFKFAIFRPVSVSLLNMSFYKKKKECIRFSAKYDCL